MFIFIWLIASDSEDLGELRWGIWWWRSMLEEYMESMDEQQESHHGSCGEGCAYMVWIDCRIKFHVNVTTAPL